MIKKLYADPAAPSAFSTLKKLREADKQASSETKNKEIVRRDDGMARNSGFLHVT
jgi:hypothetical protein